MVKISYINQPVRISIENRCFGTEEKIRGYKLNISGQHRQFNANLSFARFSRTNPWNCRFSGTRLNPEYTILPAIYLSPCKGFSAHPEPTLLTSLYLWQQRGNPRLIPRQHISQCTRLALQLRGRSGGDMDGGARSGALRLIWQHNPQLEALWAGE